MKDALLMDPGAQLFWLFVLAIPVACISWTLTNEELFRQTKEYCIRKSHDSKSFVARKFFYMLSCEYCLSHYITLLILVITGYKLLMNDWRGYLVAGFSLVWIANIYMSLYSLLRTDLKKEKVITKMEEKESLKDSDTPKDNMVKMKLPGRSELATKAPRH